MSGGMIGSVVAGCFYNGDKWASLSVVSEIADIGENHSFAPFRQCLVGQAMLRVQWRSLYG